MPKTAKFFVALVCTIGAVLALLALCQLDPERAPQFITYLFLAVLSSRMKVSLPGVTGTLSVNFVFILAAVMELGVSETVLITVLATLAQCVWGAKKRPKSAQLAFNAGNAAICGFLCYSVYHHPELLSQGSSIPIRLFWSSLFYFFMNTLNVSMIISLTEGKTVRKVWYDNFFWTAPQYVFGAGLSGLIHVCNTQFGWQYAVLVFPAVYLLDRSYRVYLRRLEEEKNHVAEVADLHLRTIKALALAIDAKDETTHDHLCRVQVYSVEIAKELKVSEDELQALKAAALLHDIGKLAVPEYIISKPGCLKAEEFEKMRIHPEVGAEILECVNFPYPVVPVVRAHHEKWNGQGYPDGLQGEEIPIGARILSVVDCFDAMTSDRPYRPALPLDVVIRHIESEAGKSFDPSVVEVMSRRYLELERMAGEAALHSVKLSPALKNARRVIPGTGIEPSVNGTGGDETHDGSMDFILSIAAARQEFQALHELTADLGNSLSLEETLSLLASRLKGLIPHDAQAIRLLRRDKLVSQHIAGTAAHLLHTVELPLGEGVSGWVAGSGEPMLNGDPSLEPGYAGEPSTGNVLQSALSVPLEGPSGLTGTLTLYHRNREAFTRDHLRILLAISSKVALTIENAKDYDEAKKSALTDELTGLPNVRPLFLFLDQELVRSRRTSTPLAVLVLDLDGFKKVNDRFGHLAGNRVLRQVADILKGSCRASDFVARMGGDEFVMILGGITQEVLERMEGSLLSAVADIGRDLSGEGMLGLSLGAALFPKDGNNAEQLLAVADRRMYQVKGAHHARTNGSAKGTDEALETDFNLAR